MKNQMITLVMLSAISTTAGAEQSHRQHEAHVHGHASLSLAVSGNSVQLEFDSPAMNLLGFEHEPSSARDQKLLHDSVEFLTRPAGWIGLDDKAGCKLAHVEVNSSLLDHDSHKEHAHEQDHHKEHEEQQQEQHADFEVAVEFQCTETGRLEKVDLSGLFEQFPGFEEIEVQWITERIQSATELSVKNPAISLR